MTEHTHTNDPDPFHPAEPEEGPPALANGHTTSTRPRSTNRPVSQEQDG